MTDLATRYDLVEGSRMCVLKMAPTVEIVTEYDRCHLLTYARLLDADRNGMQHYEAPEEILDIPPTCDPDMWLDCFLSHVDRAQWIVAQGISEIVKGPQRPTEYADYPSLFDQAQRRWLV